MGELSNCTRCNALFVKNVKDICQDCYKEEEDQFDLVYKYVRKQKNRSATLDQVSNATGVERDLIMKFVKEQRLRTSMFPNLAYPCERCQTLITDGKICGECSEDIRSDLEQEEKVESLKREDKKAMTYYNFEK
ncbi:TIGR03826 family flagellar region protein [Pontibacillus salipaludis]|uniref:TIGR03826 family flagellar region protein n=1 Tax=Pontibacillus salipaludis TaxID=1697394 RepID=UPI0031EE28EA